MAFDYSKLRGRIIEKYGSCQAFGVAMGRSKVWVSTRLNNVVAWSTDEITEACEPEKLDIAPEEIPVYFFTPKFDKSNIV